MRVQYWTKKFYDSKDVNQVWDYFIATGLFTESELQLVTSLNGFNLEVLNDCLFARYGYRDLEQMFESDE